MLKYFNYIKLFFSCLTLIVLLISHSPVVALPQHSNRTTSTLNLTTQLESFDDGIQMRQKKRVGVGIIAAGAYGLLGFQLDLNISSATSLLTGIGLGEGFQTFNLSMKRYLYGKSFWPYLGFGYSRWFSTGKKREHINETVPSFLSEKMLSEKTKKKGYFSEDIVYPSIGLQFVQMTGPWVGFSIIGEITVLCAINQLVVVPTGMLGTSYLF